MKVDMLHNKDAFSCQRSKYLKIDDDIQIDEDNDIPGNILMSFKFCQTKEIACAKNKVLKFKG